MLVAIHPIAKSSGLLAKFQLKVKSLKKSDETIYNKINAVLFPKTATMTSSPVKSLTSQIVTTQHLPPLENGDRLIRPEFEQQFDLQHLPQKSQKHALKVFKKKINIFCRHEMD